MKRWRMIPVALAMWSLISCAATPRESVDPLGAAPGDFSLDVAIVMAPAPPVLADDPPAPLLPAQLEPARYILLADGSLHYGVDSDGTKGVNWLPPLTRVLSRRQVAEVWSHLQQLGLADPNSADPTVNFKTVIPTTGERVYLIGLSGSGRFWNFIRRESLDQSPDPAVAQFVRHLAQLAWADELTDPNAKVMPNRYDFGPDPYVRYRQQ